MVSQLEMARKIDKIFLSKNFAFAAHIAFCGELFDLSFDLPFTEFLPQTVPIRFWIQGESADMSLYMPEVCTSRSILLALDENAKIVDRDGNVKTTKRDNVKKWRKICQRR